MDELNERVKDECLMEDIEEISLIASGIMCDWTLLTQSNKEDIVTPLLNVAMKLGLEAEEIFPIISKMGSLRTLNDIRRLYYGG